MKCRLITKCHECDYHREQFLSEGERDKRKYQTNRGSVIRPIMIHICVYDDNQFEIPDIHQIPNNCPKPECLCYKDE